VGHTEPVRSVSFSPDGTRIVSSSFDKAVRLWDAATGQPWNEPLEGHAEAVYSVSFSPDGTRNASGSKDSTVRLWDVTPVQPLSEPLEGHTGAVQASGSIDKTVRLSSAVKMQPSPEFRESDFSAFFLHRSTAPPSQESRIMPTNTCNIPLVCFSYNLEHALSNPADLLKPISHHNSMPTPFLLQSDGWMMGPNQQLLFWVPPAPRHAIYTPWTLLVIPRGYPELDLSRMAHGTRWSSCRDA
jgi:WD40 repeat protein